MITTFIPTIVSMAALALAGPGPIPTDTPVQRPQQLFQEIVQVSPVLSEDWEETHYLESNPGVGALIRKGLSTPVSELKEVDLTKFSNLV